MNTATTSRQKVERLLFGLFSSLLARWLSRTFRVFRWLLSAVRPGNFVDENGDNGWRKPDILVSRLFERLNNTYVKY